MVDARRLVLWGDIVFVVFIVAEAHSTGVGNVHGDVVIALSVADVCPDGFFFFVKLGLRMSGLIGESLVGSPECLLSCISTGHYDLYLL